MRQRYFLIEPKYSDPDTFCHFVVGSDRVRASIQIYADLWMLGEVSAALTAPSLKAEAPVVAEYEDGDDLFYFYLTVLPHECGNKRLRFRVFQDWMDGCAVSGRVTGFCGMKPQRFKYSPMPRMGKAMPNSCRTSNITAPRVHNANSSFNCSGRCLQIRR